jgi:three-Cys-motif partner protein
MSKKLPTMWTADPHTIAKITILRYYLNAWFRILGRGRKNQTILYVDGFAGPGSYTNHPEGSPLAALRVAESTVAELAGDFVAKEIQCAFIEKDPARYLVLQGALAGYVGKPRLGVVDFCCEFADGIERVRSKVPGPFQGQGPLFVFADPFGGTGIPFKTFARCMEGSASELLINLDADGLGRIFQANNAKRDEQLTELFGDESWRVELRPNDPLPQLSFVILELYKRRLRTLPGVEFVWSFAMRGTHDQINYHLVFASKHPLGLVKMKEAMRSIDQTGSFSFSDAHVDQHRLFTEDNEDHYADLMWQNFKDRTVTYQAAELWALNESPFVNPKSMLRVLEAQGRLVPEVITGAIRKKGDFPEEKIAALRFGQFGFGMKQPELF